jgi:hypothetical protein
MDVRRDHVTLGAVHVAELLREIVGREEVDALGAVFRMKQYGQGAAFVGDVFDHFFGVEVKLPDYS